MKRDLFYLDSYVIQKDMRMRLPKAITSNLAIECGKTILGVYVDRENNEIVLKIEGTKTASEDKNS